jgi:nitrite reductase/ring-hydroxylating ferredoxin subunit
VARFQPLEKLINLHDGYRRAFKFDHVEVLLIQEAGQCHVIERRCPHRGQPLDAAEVRGGSITCPLHGQQFSLADGALTGVSVLCRALQVLVPCYEGNEVGIELPD